MRIILESTGDEMETLSIDGVSEFTGAAVVVDVMRAFTVAALALAAGASRLVLVPELEDALSMKGRVSGALAFQDGAPVPGFDLANSPVMLAELDVDERTIFQRTTSGTRGALAARHCEPLLCASFACAAATAHVLRAHRNPRVGYVITGDGGTADEDLACAELIDRLRMDPTVSAAPFVERARQSKAARSLREAVESGYKGVDPGDVERCLVVDAVDFAMRATPEGEHLALTKITTV